MDHDETVEVKHDRTETVGHDEKITVHNNRSERVGRTKDETIVLGKALSVGAVYQVSVGAAMNTSVGLSQTCQVGVSKSTSVGKTYSIDAGDQFVVEVGLASLRLSKDGTITLSGTRIDLEASGSVKIDGKNVDINGGGESVAGGGGKVPAGDESDVDEPAEEVAPDEEETTDPIGNTLDNSLPVQVGDPSASEQRLADMNKKVDEVMADVLANGERFASTATDPRSKWPTIARGGSLSDNPEGADYPAGVLGDDEVYSKQMYTGPKGDTFPVIQTTDGRVLAYPAMDTASDAVSGSDVPQVIVSGKLEREALLAADAAHAQSSESSALPTEVFPDPVQFALDRPVNTAGQSAISLSDTQSRMNYHAANEAARDAARVTIGEAIAENNPAKATAAAYNASQLRIANRSLARTGLSKGGLALSVAVDQTMPPEFYFNKYGTAGASEFDVAARVAQGVGKSNGYVNGLGTLTKVLGPIGVGYGAYSSVTNVMNASSANQPYVIAQEAGTWAGGWYGASWGMAGGVALAVALGSNPIGWGILAVGAAGGLIGGVAGSHAGAYAAGSAYKGVTSWIR